MENNQSKMCQILVTSDVHGTILPFHYGNKATDEFGLAKIATKIHQLQDKEPNTFILDNGDSIQGTPLTYHYVKMNKEQTIHPIPLLFNHIGTHAAIIGNHEFNYGTDVLKQVVLESQFPWLSCNILDEKTGEPAFGTPYLIHTFPNGIRMGIIGATTSYIPNWEEPHHIQGLRFTDPIVELNKWVRVIREVEQVDFIAVSYHGGFERDIDSGEPTEPLSGENVGYEICYQVDGIDILITGHQHRHIPSGNINGVHIIQPGSHGNFVGQIELEFVLVQGDWRLFQIKSRLHDLVGIEPDTTILQMIQPYEQETQQWLDQPLGSIEGDMIVHDPMLVRTGDHPLIEWMNHVQMELTGAEISNTALFDNISPGMPNNVTMRDIVANYIYPNTLKVLRLKGKDILEALEQTATYFAPYNGEQIEVNPAFLEPKPQHYNFDMWEGIEYEINISKPFGERITKLTRNGKSFDLEQEYEVVMNNYRAAGGGNYFMFQNKPVVREIPTEVSELLADYFQQKGTIRATLNHNWKVVVE
ncbi:2',3'-cyclic-nucleotide 2'-phosphodiesterase / 3'-nucleotidase [Thermoactinomyces sp. DSM 45891]|uniref:bifunctional metallophosphatase/5'-nucleotidase n=1 Tax=Thermoactinomyces sp. DSM 45891 TaxID=1761907 RepID=UPI00091C9CB9|nr:bifunctional UDP-sugar hydrolase/5'-nucleotidase [Thermoactinomyces sp. DSM 45891]SFX13200.1 2',3'-cyclic-nucleotide 2'-phosphodiesterase / 3'-nucleotidase [Thermoactinomyces sp. DSM 45891]